MPYAKISEENKQRLFDAFRRGEDYVEVARVLGIKRDTAYRIIRSKAFCFKLWTVDITM